MPTTEGTGSSAGQYVFNLGYSGVVGGLWVRKWQVQVGGADGTAGSDDFPGGVLPSGASASSYPSPIFISASSVDQVTVNVLADGFAEPDETFTLSVGDASYTATIVNDDAVATSGIAPLQASLPEGGPARTEILPNGIGGGYRPASDGITRFTFGVARTGDPSAAASVGYSVAGSGTRPATTGDFAGGSLPAGVLAFAAGQASAVLTVQVRGDTQPEPNEAFTVTLANPSPGLVLANTEATGTITADDPITGIIAHNTTSNTGEGGAAVFYDGPVPGLEQEIILVTQDNLRIAVTNDNWFLHSGSGTDAIAAHGGRNVLDGGAGSNFLVGGTGADSFFLDARDGLLPIWSTVANLAPSEAVTLWGLAPGDVVLAWADGEGAVGYTGLTLHAVKSGGQEVTLTLSGYAQADFGAGRLVFAFGHEPVSNGDYLYVAAT